MAKFYPPMPIPGQDGTVPRGERLLFEKLRGASGTDGWHVLHSYYFANHLTQRVGEADFVVLIPGKGIVVVEVKSHGPAAVISRRHDGTWQLGSTTSLKGPFRQASDNAETLRSQLREFGRESPDPTLRNALDDVVVASAVWFTHRDVLGIPPNGEWQPWQVLHRRDHAERPAAKSLLSVLDNHRQHLIANGLGWLRASAEPTAATVRAIVGHLRPAFEVPVQREATARAVQEELRRFTEEQFAVLDVLVDQPRAEIAGAAGTGKTFLALEMARRRAALGERVLLCCYNKGLGAYLEESTKGTPGVTAGTLHRQLLLISGLVPQDSHEFWSRDLPLAALETMLDDGFEPYDSLVIDECQDLASDVYLDCLDLMVTGGLSGGRVMFFGDSERQAIYGNEGNADLRQRIPALPPAFRLPQNCRNTPETAVPLLMLCGLNPSAYTGFRRPENEYPPPVQRFADGPSQGTVLARIFEELRNTRNRYQPDDVVVLSPRREPDAILELPTTDAWKGRLSGYRAPGRVWHTTIHAFKGLESPVVVLVGIEGIQTDEEQALLYVGLTRHTERLFVLASTAVQAELQRRLND